MKLLPGEKVIIETAPQSSLKSYRLFSSLVAVLAFVILLGLVTIIVAATAGFLKFGFLIVLGEIVLMGLVRVIPLYIENTLRFNKMYYWITNKRIIVKRGLIGDEERSILIERLGEVIIMQTWLQGMFGLHFIVIEVIGNKNKEILPGMPNAPEMKQLLLNLISEKRKAEKLTY